VILALGLVFRKTRVYIVGDIMTISELIERLQKLELEHGNLPVYCHDGEDGDWIVADTLVDDAEGEGKYFLPRRVTLLPWPHDE
jgi:hypothetical protein